MAEAVFIIMMSIGIILEIVLLFVNIAILIETFIEAKKGKKPWVTKQKPKAKQNKGPTVLK